MCDQYLLFYHKESILEIMENMDENKHYSININFLELFENDPNLGNSVLKEPEQSLEEWNSAILKVQSDLMLQSERNLILKKNVHFRICGLPVCPELHRSIFPRNDDANKFLQVSGTVVRITSAKMLEYQRQYICTKCKHAMTVKAEYEKKNIIIAPKKCSSPECNGTNIITCGELDANYCKDYQEIKMQETVTKLEVGCMPNSIWVTLEDDLVDSCKPGDNITVCGVVKRRWSQFFPNKKVDIQLVIKANHLQVNNNNGSATLVTPEIKGMFQGFWKTYADKPLVARDIILKSICPQIFGLYMVKLAVAVVLAGGSQVQDTSSTGVRLRTEPHLLLVGDPGTGKSQLLRFASKIIPRSVLTTGVGSTAAGLTVTAVMEDGEWQLEGGALVLSDGGICCIDEFNSMKEHDRTSIHEAMEQQTISVAKASIVCKLSTRCSVLAATNPKGNIDPSQPLNMNVALASPLLSRFDLILILRDKVNEEWDTLVTEYILNSQNNCSKLTDVSWTVEMLQAYFSVIKKIHPILTPDSNKILSNYYQAQRRRNYRNKSRTTVRLLDSLVRLSQGHARLMHHDKVEIVDAVTAVILVETAMDAESSVFDLHFDVQNDFPTSPMKNYRELIEIVLNRLELQDILKEELTIIDEQLSSKFDFCAPDKQPQKPPKHKVESKYFNFQNDSVSDDKVHDIVEVQKDSEKENKTDFDNHKININRIRAKRSKEQNRGKTKKIKLKDDKNDAVSDLALLNLIPSINHNYSLLDDVELNQDIDSTIIPLINGNENELIECIQSNDNKSTSIKPCDTDVPNKNNIKEAKNENKQNIHSDLSQSTKRKLFLNKFRFKPREIQGVSENRTENAIQNNGDNSKSVKISKTIFESQEEEAENLDLDI